MLPYARAFGTYIVMPGVSRPLTSLLSVTHVWMSLSHLQKHCTRRCAPAVTQNPDLIADSRSSMPGLSEHIHCIIAYLAHVQSYRSIIVSGDPFHTLKHTVPVGVRPQ